MSIRVMSQVWDNGPSAQGDLLVMLALADWCNDQGECWPSMAGIAEKARLSDQRSARRIIRRLEASGWIEIDAGGGRHGCNRYTLKLGPKVPRTESPPRTVEPYPPGLSLPETRTVEPPEPSLTVKEPSVKKAREALLSVLSPEAADDFIEHRKAKRAKLTPRAAELIAKTLEGHPDPDAVVNESIKNGWTGVFPKPQAKGPRDERIGKGQERLNAFIAGARGSS